MGRYRKIDTRIWNDEKFRSLSDDGKLVFLFILTHPHLTSLGAMRATLPGLARELGWPVQRFLKGFGEPFRKGLIEHDETAAFVGLPHFLRYNPPDNPNVVKSWGSALDLLPECELRSRLVARAERVCQTLSKGFSENLPPVFRAIGKPFRIQEQEQEQEQEKETLSSPIGDLKNKPRRNGKPKFEERFKPYEATFDLWWAAYPRRIAKLAAQRAWLKVMLNLAKGSDEPTAIARLLVAAEKFAEAVGKREKEFIPYPATWLNAGSYDDDLAELADGLVDTSTDGMIKYFKETGRIP